MLEMVGIPRARYDRVSPPVFRPGMKQRVVIAMSIACSPELILADEPTTALDVTIQAQILDLFRKIQKDLNTATIFVTHDLGVVCPDCGPGGGDVRRKNRRDRHGGGDFLRPTTPLYPGPAALPPGPVPGEGDFAHPAGNAAHAHGSPCRDAFAYRNDQALAIDYEEAPPMFSITPTHAAATWLLDPRAEKNGEEK